MLKIKKSVTKVSAFFIALMMMLVTMPIVIPSTVYASSVAGGWSWPLDNPRTTWGASLSSHGNFGAFSQNQQNTWRQGAPNHRGYHLGQDIAGSNNTVRAAAAGTVVAVGSSWVVISHPLQNGRAALSFYDHLYGGVRVSQNASVSRGTHIGNTTGHLHFAIITDANFTGRFHGWGTRFSGNSTTFSVTNNGQVLRATYHNPWYVINNNRIPGMASSGTTSTPATAHTVTISSNRTQGTTADRFDFTARTNFNATRVILYFAGGQTFTMNRSTDGRTHTLPGNSLRAESNRLVSVHAYEGNRRAASSSMRVTVTAPTQIGPRISGINIRQNGRIADVEIRTTGAVGNVTLRFNNNNTVFRPWNAGGGVWRLNGNNMAPGGRSVTVRIYDTSGRFTHQDTTWFTVW